MQVQCTTQQEKEQARGHLRVNGSIGRHHSHACNDSCSCQSGQKPRARHLLVCLALLRTSRRPKRQRKSGLGRRGKPCSQAALPFARWWPVQTAGEERRRPSEQRRWQRPERQRGSWGDASCTAHKMGAAGGSAREGSTLCIRKHKARQRPLPCPCSAASCGHSGPGNKEYTQRVAGDRVSELALAPLSTDTRALVGARVTTSNAGAGSLGAGRNAVVHVV